MRYTTKITRRQVIHAFDLWMKRRAALAWKYPYSNYHRTVPHGPQVTKKALPPALTMKSIAEHCGISYSTLLRLTETDFRVSEFKRLKLVTFANRHYRS